MMTDLTNLTVAQIRDGHRSGNFTAVEVAEAFSANVAGAKALNAFIVETPDHALAAAKQADADRADGTLKPLSGVPIGMKDLFATKGVQTTAASHMLEGFVPQYESTVSQKLWDAGAGMLGKLNLDQFAMGSSNETSYFGNVISPWRKSDGSNAALAPGGSSGGSSTAIAARLCPAATGTDTGGSIRQPAAFTGISGSNRPMAAVPAGALWRSPAVLIKPGRWRATCRIARSCWRRWQGSTPRMPHRWTCQCPIGKRLYQAI